MRGWLWLLGWVWCVAFAQTDALRSAEEALESALKAPSAQKRAIIKQANRSLNALPAEARSPLDRLIQQAENSLAQDDIETALEAVRTYQAVASSPVPMETPQEVRAQLEHIYAQPDMQIPEKNLFERMNEAFYKALERLAMILQRLFGGRRLGGGLSATTQAVLIGLLIVVIALFGAYLLQRVQFRRTSPTTQLSLESAFQDARVMHASEWYALAHRLAGEGQYGLAVRALYLGMLRLLNEHRLLAYDPALTNWEHLERLRKPPTLHDMGDSELRLALYQALRPPTLRFDHLWYGNQPATADDFQQFDTLFQQLQGRLSQSATPVA